MHTIGNGAAMEATVIPCGFFVSELLTAIKIRTGERGGDAIIDDTA